MVTELPSIPWDTLMTSRDDEECFLGQGSFSTVVRCYHRAHGDVAVKILKTTGSNPINSFSKEGLVHLKANSFEHILSLYGIAQHKGFVCLVLEYMPHGDLAGLLNSRLEIPWTFRLRALSETASALAYLHNIAEDQRVIHCDLKSENILLSSDLHIKIADFGGATLSNYTGASIEPSRKGSHEVSERLIQYTLSHAAPELLIQMDKKRTRHMDTYSFAIIMYFVSSRTQPFGKVHPSLISHAVGTGQRPRDGLEDIQRELESNGENVSKGIFDLFVHLMENCWKKVPEERFEMSRVRDDLLTKLNGIDDKKILADVISLKHQLPALSKGGMPLNPINIFDKYRHLPNRMNSLEVRRRATSPEQPSFSRRDNTSERQFSPIPSLHPTHTPTHSGLRRQPVSGGQLQPSSINPQVSPQQSSPSPLLASTPPPSMQPVEELSRQVSDVRISSEKSVRPTVLSPKMKPLAVDKPGIRELEASFADPFLRQGNEVRMITDVAAIKNAQINHGGWNDSLLQLRDVTGRITKVEENDDVVVSFSGVQSHRFNPRSLVRIPSENDFHIGDLVVITIDKELVKLMQENHGGWADDMNHIYEQTGLIFRFVQEGDILVVYKNGLYFRFNPEVLCKGSDPGELYELSLPDNPSIKIGDYVCHDMEEDLLKTLQERSGGWNSEMSNLKGRVGKLVYADYHGRAFIAYNSKCCYAFNPAAITKLSENEAIRRFKNYKEESTRLAKIRAEDKKTHHRFAAGDVVRVHLPLDIMVELQRGHGGWCYQMLEVYGLKGVVKDFDESQNVQVLFDTGHKWTFNPAVLDLTTRDDSAPPPSYSPPFRIGDKVRVKIEELDNFSENKIRHVCRSLQIDEDKMEILIKSGVVLGIDDDIDVIVTFGDGKNYGIKPEQLEKIE